MSAAEDLVGQTLTGHRNGRNWNVTEKLAMLPGQSGGYFSVGYFAEDHAGTKAFLKASDLSRYTANGQDFLTGLLQAANAHNFERRILDRCIGNRMDRVVTALDYGDAEVISDGVRDRLFFLVFERADGDLRKHVEKQGPIDLLWCVTALHNFFIAINQLHSALVAHNDIKPGNALVFDKDTQKIADLGRATSTDIPADHDALQCAGDRRFAPPEQLYPADLNCGELPAHVRRAAGDLYNLGSITHYMLTARMVTPEIIVALRPEFRPRNMAGGSRDSYQAALPYWRDSFDQVIERLRSDSVASFGPAATSEVSLMIDIVTQLCEPDPLLRGHPLNQSATQSRYSLQRYISSLANARAKLAIKAA
jgi:eukaryotic-like serine/threonine-protein kinase